MVSIEVMLMKWPFSYITAIIISAGVFYADNSLAGTVTAANTNVSADTAMGTYVTLTGPSYVEAPAGGEIGTGTIILSNAPAGFIFNTNAVVKVKVTGSATSSKNINGLASGSTITATVKTNTISITITSKSSTANTLTWQNVQVRAVSGKPRVTRNITKSGTASMAGVTAGSTSFGTLTEVAG